MDKELIETRARIACRIYLKLFEAGDQGTVIVFDEMDPAPGPGAPNHYLVRDVLESLLRHAAVHQPDAAKPLLYVLDNAVRARMADRRMLSRRTGRTPERINVADRLREEIAYVDDGSTEVPHGTFSKIEAFLRTDWDSTTDPI